MKSLRKIWNNEVMRYACNMLRYVYKTKYLKKSKSFIIIFTRWNKFLFKFCFFSCVYKNIKMEKKP